MEQTINPRKELFENTPVPKAVLTLAFPTVAACLVMVLYNLADTFFVGLLNDASETGAVTLAAPVLLAFNAVTNLFGTGGASMVSRALGRKETETAALSANLSFYGGLFFALLYSLISVVFKEPLLTILGATADTAQKTQAYLFWTVTLGSLPAILNIVLSNLVRAEGRAVHASVGTLLGCLLNILLDPIFILPWGLDMGAAGAGAATFLSNCVALLYYVILLIIKRKDTIVRLSPTLFRLDRTVLKGIFGVGIPASIQNLLNVTGMTVLNNFAAAYGAEAVSAAGIAHKLGLIPLYIAMGVAQGIMPLVGYNYGSGNRARMREAVNITERFELISMVILGGLCTIFSSQLISLFMKNELIVQYGSILLKGQALALPFLGYDFMGVSVFQACGMGKTSLVFAIARKIILEIPALFILNRLFPLYGLGFAQLAAEVVLSIAAFILLRRILKDPEAA